ncbi:MAG: glycogen synthase GlgA [Clostridia bacterium]|nr:glycogen synthase GlgA [Clostridia bacterium]
MAATTTKKTTAKTTAAKTATATKATTTKTTATKTATAKKSTPATEKITEKKKILFVASEATPFIQTGGLAEVIGSLSTALAKSGNFDVRVVIPLYSDIKKEYRDKFTYLGNLYVHLAWRNQYCGVFSYEKEGVIFYFIDNEFYFKRPGCYGYFDDGERFAFFSRAVLEIMPFINFYPEVMHCHDWQAALAAIYLKTNYCFRQEYQFIRSLFTIHNIEYQGQYSLDILSSLFDIYGKYQYLVEYNNSINLMKGAIEVSERFSTVSPKYADEIKDAYYAHGLDPIIRNNAFKLRGILNGIDDKGYNSELDSHLFANFTADDVSGKAVCKRELQKMLNLPEKPDTPVISMISRLVSHKGLDLVTNVIEEVLQDDVQLVILGTGDYQYEAYFRELAKRYPDKVSANIVFNGDLSRKIYSGSDIFLMPSKSEPCGLSQMIACRYATVPVVRETGGLYDSIKPLENGYTFANYNAHDMLYVIRQAVSDYKNKKEWAKLRYRAATTDFSWNKSAKEYEALYLEMLK